MTISHHQTKNRFHQPHPSEFLLSTLSRFTLRWVPLTLNAFSSPLRQRRRSSSSRQGFSPARTERNHFDFFRGVESMKADAACLVASHCRGRLLLSPLFDRRRSSDHAVKERSVGCFIFAKFELLRILRSSSVSKRSECALKRMACSRVVWTSSFRRSAVVSVDSVGRFYKNSSVCDGTAQSAHKINS